MNNLDYPELTKDKYFKFIKDKDGFLILSKYIIYIYIDLKIIYYLKEQLIYLISGLSEDRFPIALYELII